MDCTRVPRRHWWDGWQWIACKLCCLAGPRCKKLEYERGWLMLGMEIDRMLGSLTVYRRLLNERVFNRIHDGSDASNRPKLPALGHAIAGTMAGSTGACLQCYETTLSSLNG